MADLPLILLLLLAVAVVLRVDFIFYVVYVLAGIYLLARWRTGRTLPRLRVSRRFTDHLFNGETARVEVEIANPGWWPIPWLRYEEAAPERLAAGGGLRQVVALRPKERLRLSYDVVGEQRGHYPIGPGRLVTGDLFGLAQAEGLYEEPRYLTVYPRVVPLTDVGFTSQAPHGVIASAHPIFADPARVGGVRAYSPGDPLRSIDWKTSARAGGLQVKKYEPAVSLTTVIFLDLNRAAYARALQASASEWAVVVAASLANGLVARRQAVGLASNGADPASGATCWRLLPRPGRGHLMKLLEWLARVQLAEAEALADWLPGAAADLPWGTTVVAVTPDAGEGMLRALHRLRRNGLNPVLLAVEPYAYFAVVQERARRLGVAAHPAWSEAELARSWAGRPVAAAIAGKGGHP